ncbi:MAG: sigma factor-like helix-turn-helix DNA-binding protein [Clostridia bacterium]
MELKRQEISDLFDYYAPVLSARQRDVLDLYYNEDLSLSEIAENLAITRQAVRDAIIHGEEALYSFEERLQFVAREKTIKCDAENIIRLTDNPKIISLANKIIDASF